MKIVTELRISDIPGGSAGRRRVEVMWRDGAARRVAVAEVAGLPGRGEGERVRWYLEDYAEFPADPAPVIAREAEAQLVQAGAGLFCAVFADVDAVGIWERDRLGQVRVEVEADPREGQGGYRGSWSQARFRRCWTLVTARLLRAPGSGDTHAHAPDGTARQGGPTDGMARLPEFLPRWTSAQSQCRATSPRQPTRV